MRSRLVLDRIVLGAVLALAGLGAGPAQASTLYGGTGPVIIGSEDPGEIHVIDPGDGSGTTLGDAVAAVDTGIVGLDFDALGRLFGVTRHSPGFGQPRNAGELIEIDPLTGASLGSIGIIMEGSTPIPINDLAFQPGTGVLFGTATGGGDAPCASCLYTIDLTTAQATFVGDPGQSNAAWNKSGGLAFAPDGTLYGTTTFTNPVLAVLDPTDGSVLSIESVVVAPPANTGFGGFFDGLAVRPEDGVLFATHGVASSEIFMRNPTTTQWELIGAPGPALSDLAFLSVPEPGGALLLATGMAALATRRRRLR